MKMEDDLIFFVEKLEWRTPKKMEEDLKKNKTNQSSIINLIGCDTIVNSPFVSMSGYG